MQDPMLVERIRARCREWPLNADGVGGCWEFIGSRHPDGYGRIFVKKANRYAHRVMYEAYYGLSPDGYEVDHVCSNSWCVNPAHLERVTPAENQRRKRDHRFRRFIAENPHVIAYTEKAATR